MLLLLSGRRIDGGDEEDSFNRVVGSLNHYRPMRPLVEIELCDFSLLTPRVARNGVHNEDKNPVRTSQI